MAGIAVHGKDRAGGAQEKEVNTFFRVGGEPVVVIGDTVAPHGDPPHSPAPKMVEGTSWFRVNGKPVCRAGHKAGCGHATTGRSWFQIYEKGERKYILSPADPCNVEHVPAIMRAQDPPWAQGAMLLDRWFNGTANTDRSAVPPDTTTITMDYVLGFPYPKSVYDRSLQAGEKFWLDDATKAAVVQQLRQDPANPLGDSPARFDYIDLPAAELVSAAVHRESISIGDEKEHDASLTLNSIDASLGSYNLYYNVAGSVEPLPDGRHQIRIDAVGIYVHDSFDFEGFQYLGHWDVDGHAVHVSPISFLAYKKGYDLDDPLTAGCKITNASFRAWREATGHGQDFYILSDIRRLETIGPTFTFTDP
jgi:uncharacterized Zn-binding protein involved in type VI secretion